MKAAAAMKPADAARKLIAEGAEIILGPAVRATRCRRWRRSRASAACR